MCGTKIAGVRPCTVGRNGIDGRVAHIFNSIIELCVKRRLERKNRKHLVDIFFYRLDAVGFPCPQFWRNIVIDRRVEMRFDIFGYPQIETRIVNQNHHVGTKTNDSPPRVAQVAQYGRQMAHYCRDAHKCHVAIVLDLTAALGCHQIAAEKTELGCSIMLLQCRHQIRTVQIARCFACYDKIFH